MAVNANRPERWKADITQSVDFYNDWFVRFAPQTYRDSRRQSTVLVEEAFLLTSNLANIGADVLHLRPSLLPILRMATAPPIARDRLIGLAGVTAGLVRSLEIEKRIPPRITADQLNAELGRIASIFVRLIDIDILPWLKTGNDPSTEERYRQLQLWRIGCVEQFPIRLSATPRSNASLPLCSNGWKLGATAYIQTAYPILQSCRQGHLPFV